MTQQRSGPKALLNWLVFDRDKATPIYRQIRNRIRDAVPDGRLPPGSLPPASRPLVQDPGVSRHIVTQCYDPLSAAGLLEVVRGAGTRVTSVLAQQSARSGHQVRQVSRTSPVHSQFQQQSLIDGVPPALAFQPGIPAHDAFPACVGRGF